MAKGGKGSDSTLGGGIIGIIILIAIVPKQVWIVLGVTIGVSVLVWLIYKAMTAYEAHRIEAAEQARIRDAADAARAKQEREEAVRKAKQRLIETLGEKNAGLVDSAPTSIITAPSSAIFRPRSMALPVSKNSPPSLKESGVTFKTPITIQPAEKSNLPLGHSTIFALSATFNFYPFTFSHLKPNTR